MGKDGLGFLIVKLITRYPYTGEQIRVEKISRRKKMGLWKHYTAGSETEEGAMNHEKQV